MYTQQDLECKIFCDILKTTQLLFNSVTPIKQININDRIQNYLKPLALKMLKVVRPVPVCKIPTSLDECEIILKQLFQQYKLYNIFCSIAKNLLFCRPNSLCRKCRTHNFYYEGSVGRANARFFLLRYKKSYIIVSTRSQGLRGV